MINHLDEFKLLVECKSDAVKAPQVSLILLLL